MHLQGLGQNFINILQTLKLEMPCLANQRYIFSQIVPISDNFQSNYPQCLLFSSDPGQWGIEILHDTWLDNEGTIQHSSLTCTTKALDYAMLRERIRNKVSQKNHHSRMPTQRSITSFTPSSTISSPLFVRSGYTSSSTSTSTNNPEQFDVSQYYSPQPYQSRQLSRGNYSAATWFWCPYH